MVTVNPHDLAETRKVFKEEIDRAEPSVVICRAPCVLIPSEKKKTLERFEGKGQRVIDKREL